MIPPVHPLPGGLVIVFEGIDGVGKTTQLKLAEQALTEAGWPVLTTRNLGGTPIGEALRKIIKSDLSRPPFTDLYISLAIQEALLPVIAEARQAGKVILLDRGPLSLAAYQIYGTGIDKAVGWPFVEQGMKRLRPDLTILYGFDDAAEALGRKRQQLKTTDHFESQPLKYFQRVARGYKAAGERYAVEIISAAQTIEAIHKQTIRLVAQILTPRSLD